MRVLVTGGGGYLGSWLVSLLLEAGHGVRVLDRFCFGEASIKDFVDHPKFECIVAPICTMIFPTEAQVIGGSITSSPGPIPRCAKHT